MFGELNLGVLLAPYVLLALLLAVNARRRRTARPDDPAAAAAAGRMPASEPATLWPLAGRL